MDDEIGRPPPLAAVNGVNNNLSPIQDGLFQGCSRTGGEGAKRLPSLKSVTHILQL